MHNYNVGDRVRVKSDLIVNRRYGDNTVVSDMTPLCGKVVTIKTLFRDSEYTIEESSRYWTNEMFESKDEIITTPEGFDDYNVGDRVKVIESLSVRDRWKCCGATSAMTELKGTIVTIKSVREERGAKYYTIEEDHYNYNWVSEMFEGRIGIQPHNDLVNGDMPLKPIGVGDRVRVKRNINTDMSFQGWNVSSDMVDLRGSIITISHVGRDSDGIYYDSEEGDDDGDDLTWTIDMIERLDIVPKSSEAGIIKAMKNFSDEDLEWEIERRRKQG